MYKIVKKEVLNPTVTLMEVEAPFVAKKAKAGQFIILIVDEGGERIPLTVAGTDEKRGTVEIIFQVVGATTLKLNHKEVGNELYAFAGPLGEPTKMDGINRVCVIGGGVGCAIALPISRGFKAHGSHVTSIVGFRNKDLVILEKEFTAASDEFVMMSDDGSIGKKGVVTVGLEDLIKEGKQFDEVFAVGPIIMMKFVVQTCKKYNIPCVVSMNPLMIDGTGMCGCCRITVGGKTKFACVDGPDFDGYEVDFDEAMSRNTMYRDFERKAYDETCNLFKKEVK